MPVYGAPGDVSVIFNAGFSTPAVLTTRSTAVSDTHIKILQICKLISIKYVYSHLYVNTSNIVDLLYEFT